MKIVSIKFPIFSDLRAIAIFKVRSFRKFGQKFGLLLAKYIPRFYVISYGAPKLATLISKKKVQKFNQFIWN
jgi:hypothetical protein